MQVTVLGGLEVLVDGAPADLGGPEPQALLALLVAAEGRPVSVPHLVDQIWGEEPPGRAEASLQSYVARLRKELEPARQARATTGRLRTRIWCGPTIGPGVCIPLAGVLHSPLGSSGCADAALHSGSRGPGAPARLHDLRLETQLSPAVAERRGSVLRGL